MRSEPRSQYLEAYLWPHFSACASREHLLSMIVLVNEKFRESLPAWACFADADKFGLFFRRCASLLTALCQL